MMLVIFRNVLFALLLALPISLSAQNMQSELTHAQTKMSGLYESFPDDPTVFLSGDYVASIGIQLFPNGNYVQYRKMQSQSLAEDIKIESLSYGNWEATKDLLFLLPHDPTKQFSTFILINGGFKGIYSQYTYKRSLK